MMASNLLSRLLPSVSGSPSVYERLRELDQSSDTTDLEARAGLTLDEENLAQPNFELDPALADAMASHSVLGDSFPVEPRRPRETGHTRPRARKPSWAPQTYEGDEADEADDDVPLSLLVEEEQIGTPASPGYPRTDRSRDQLDSIPVAGQATGSTRAKWRATQEQQRLYQDPQSAPSHGARPDRVIDPLALGDPKMKAMWRWANIENLDNFLWEVYDYFIGNGIWCILLSRVLNLLTLAFVVGFGTFLTSCIDFKNLPESKTMSQIVIPQCTTKMSGFANLLIWVIAFLWIAKFFQYLLDTRRLKHMHDFFHYLLEIPDTDIQTISWQEVVKRLMSLRDANPSTASAVTERHRKYIGTQSKQRMDAHDIANRLMRRDNFLIALFNKEILDLTVPLPFLRKKQVFSRTLEWNLSLCILDFVFNDQGQVRPLFLKDTHRKDLSDGLRRRFLFAGFMNVMCAPFIIIYFVVLYFFRYFNEYQKNPAQLGSRQYTPLAEWKFREFNELWHLFQRRINMSYPFASRYINQFPKDKTIQASRFVAFVTGALVSILALATIIDPELFLGFEITHERTALFYLGLFGTIWAVARGAVPEENIVFDPEFALERVTEYTHYSPTHWQGRMHSDEVRKEFAQLYQIKVVIFLEEILGILFTPFVLWFSLSRCSDRIVDFFREFTLHVDGLGHVCSFAVFDFKKGNNPPQQQQGDSGQDLRADYYSTKDGKMLASYYGFLDNYVTNPKAGAPFLHPSRKPQFHPPPTFPGLTSPHLRGEEHEGGNHVPSHWSRPHRPTQKLSPMTSILLDPQHQPVGSNVRQFQSGNAHSRLRVTRKPYTDLVEGDEEDNLEAQERVAESGRDTIDDSKLGDSWKTTRAGAVDEGAGTSTQTVIGDKGPGVLGLVYQFSKAQTEGRGTGVNI